MTLYFYKAECGDAARIEFKDAEGKSHHIFIDGGYERTYREMLSDDVETLTQRAELVDLWVVSHIHDDHIGGVITYLDAVSAGIQRDIVIRWLYNAPRAGSQVFLKNAISTPESIDQGDQLTSYLQYHKALPSEVIMDQMKPIFIDDLKLTILSPDREKMDLLYKKYRNPEVALEKMEVGLVSDAASLAARDYHKKVGEFDPAKFKEDNSEDNGSSIVLLTERKGKKVLWLADSHPSVVIRNLRKLGYSQNNKLRCDWVKVTHHGSSANNSAELYSMIECQNFLMSVDGYNKHKLPTKECLVRILKNPNRNMQVKYVFYFTYDDPIIRALFTVDGPKVFEELNFEVVYLENGKYFQFEL